MNLFTSYNTILNLYSIELTYIVGLCLLLGYYMIFFLNNPENRKDFRVISKFLRLSSWLMLVCMYISYSFFDFEIDFFLIEFNHTIFDINQRILFYKSLIILFSYLFIYILRRTFADYTNFSVDYLFLILLSILGGLLLVGSNNFLMFYLALELVGIPLYILVASNKYSNYSTEAGLKYFVIGAIASSFILFGLGIFYGIYGATSFSELNIICSVVFIDLSFTSFIEPQTIIYWLHLITLQPLLIFGSLFFFVGIFIKLGLAPFHFWMPDVYIGAPSIITLYLMTIQKAILWFTFLELCHVKLPFLLAYSEIISIIIILNFLFGIFPTLYQTKFKRFIVYSSISTNSLLLLSLFFGSYVSFLFFFNLYIITTFGIFCFYFLLRDQIVLQFINKFVNFKNLVQMHPILILALSVLFVSSAGLPPTLGFFAKFFIYFYAWTHSPTLVIFSIIASILMAFYYFRVLRYSLFLDNINQFGKNFLIVWQHLKLYDEGLLSLLIVIIIFNTYYITCYSELMEFIESVYLISIPPKMLLEYFFLYGWK